MRGVDNPLQKLIDDVDSGALTLPDYNVPPRPEDCGQGESTLNCYFRRALAFPYRYAVVTADPQGLDPLTIVQATKSTCDGSECYVMQPQSLDKECAVPQLQLFGATAPTDTGFEVTTTPDTVAPRAFGFYVPLVVDYSPLEVMPTDEAAQVWLMTQPNIRAEMFFPSVSSQIECSGDTCDDASGCMQLVGYIDRCAFKIISEDLSFTDAYVEANPPGVGPSLCEEDDQGEPVPAKYIKAVLNFELIDGSIVTQ